MPKLPKPGAHPYRLNDLTPEYNDEVVILSGANRGRIGVCDDSEGAKAIIYFGYPLHTKGYFLIPKKSIRIPTIDELLKRQSLISNAVMRDALSVEAVDPEERCDLLTELNLIENLVFERMHYDHHRRHQGKPKKVFLSHSSKDKWLVRRIHDDLRHLGHAPWLDEVKIKPGEPLIERIEHGAQSSDFLLVFISENSVTSSWVRAEWEAKMLDEIQQKKIRIIAARLDDAKMPPILARKKYADFRGGYFEGLDDILKGIGHRGKHSNADVPWRRR